MDIEDEKFYKRADEHIALSNQQLSDSTRGKVSASMMFSVARFNAWISAFDFKTQDGLQQNRDETIQYFVDQYKKMLEENFDDYIQNFDSYMGKGK